MGKKAEYKCEKCGNTFESHSGGGFVFDEYRCVNCDKIFRVKLKGKSDRVPIEEMKNCDCGGELRKDLLPMCEKCGSRDVEEIKVIMYYD
ncbi:hypothetical protein KKF81_06910 [Candidatus Micrarchaeota archaeon]|nr:hypothetical protein [Candidatus Micrarchaeota archaeon]MBU1166660.1 hypothetical protein [Candidatus Micrarchaeota archaeon]MBU1886617.1 hypothetical protein [Candidatus Micrarchaeota archaeon]